MSLRRGIDALGSENARYLQNESIAQGQAAVLSEPTASIGEDRKAFRILQALSEPEFGPTMQWSLIVANRDVIAREPEMIGAVLRGSRRSYEHARDNPGEFTAFAAQRYGVDPSVVRHSLEREQDGYRYDCAVDMAGLDLAIQLQHRLGAFNIPLNARDITDLRFLPQ